MFESGSFRTSEGLLTTLGVSGSGMWQMTVSNAHQNKQKGMARFDSASLRLTSSSASAISLGFCSEQVELQGKATYVTKTFGFDLGEEGVVRLNR